MWIDIRPLKHNRDFRCLYFGQFISFFGTMLSFVALPYQIYELTESTLAVGLLSLVELAPLLITAFIGGALADVMDRRKLLLRAEMGMSLGCLLLVFNALLPHPQVWVIFVIAGLLSAFNGLHRPSLDAMVPRLVRPDEIQAVSVLNTLKGTLAMIGGPAVAGICIATLGVAWTFALDFCTFVFSIFAIASIQSMPPLEVQERPGLKSVKESIRYALSRQELLGTYVVDLSAMVFAMPNALFPALAHSFGNIQMLGWLYSAPAVGAFLVSVLSGWTKKVEYHGLAVIRAAFCWGLAIAAVGFSNNIHWALIFLVFAGAADGISGIFRSTIWNQTIPDKIRGRMASLEMISYMTGPLVGNAQAGFLASIIGLNTAILWGGCLCMIGVCLCAWMLPGFRKYTSLVRAHPPS